MGSKSSRSDATSDLTTIAHHHQSKNKVLLLGPSYTGKSALFSALKRVIPNGSSLHYSYKDPEEEMQLACLWVFQHIYLLMNEEERKQMDASIPHDQKQEVLPLLHAVAEGDRLIFNLQQQHHGGINNHSFAEILSNLWRIPYFREFYESNWALEQSALFENVPEMVRKIDSKTPFDPSSLIYKKTVGMAMQETMWKNTLLEIVDVGGRRNERRKWLHCFDGVQTVIYLASLSEFNQVLAEDSITKRMVESKLLVNELFGNRFFENCRKILVFTKPDILMKKLLQCGIEYSTTGGGDSTASIRELDVIGDYKVKLTIHSIISEYLEALEGVKFDSYHIVNTTSDEDVKSVCDMLFGLEKTPQKTTFISHCLLPVNNRMKLALYNNCLKGNLVDLQVITLEEDGDWFQ